MVAIELTAGLDVTEQWVKRHKRLILTFKNVLAALESGQSEAVRVGRCGTAEFERS
jgi:hypothetical protein